ncbi:MAG: hypothetical protein AAGH38_01480, partial [Pseudomonadota bacterium]
MRKLIAKQGPNSQCPGMDTLYEIDFEIIADSYPGSLSLADLTLPDSPLVAVNASFLAMTEYRDHEVIGRN